ncbi:hypothetical protein MQC88_12600 [Luteimonas sp. 50]|uniref:Uncharacterized protein n=1 Tax=Cognatiluteimonas sedimenti TaxID=2927791 RepID=A0ABT0A740_9GAMM|nr:hypothetical protein [Lysobacter sedimenti]MCJ0826782.1 hypothetical protein [Lysobacter sedimenti]
MVRFAVRLPITGVINGPPVQLVVDCAGAALLLNGKLLMLNAYLVEDEPQPAWRAHAASSPTWLNAPRP